MFDKTDKGSKLDRETNNFIKEIENKEKGVDKKGFMKYFSYEALALVNNLLDQNTQDLRKRLNEIKQQKIKLDKDERNSTNNKNENDRLNMILSVIDRIYQLLEYKFLLREQPDESNLPKWIKVSKRRFDVIKKKVQNAKSNNLQARSQEGKVININESKKLLHEIENSQITYEEALKIIENIRSDINRLVSAQSVNSNQVNALNIILMINEIFTGESESVGINEKGDFEIFKEKWDKEKQEPDEQLDTTDMPELEIEESVAERRKKERHVLKILTPNPMLSRLPISLAQLKAVNNSQKLKNEIRQPLYPLYRWNKLTKQLYKSLVDII